MEKLEDRKGFGRVMVDIETLDTKNSAVILEIAAVRFDHFGIGEYFYRRLAWKEQRERTISADTLAWWTEQEQFADVLTGTYERVPLPWVMTELNRFIQHADEFWSKGSFDFDILADAAKQIKLPVPWGYNQIRDYRTLAKLAKSVGITERGDNNHNALQDAMNQAELASRFLAFLERNKNR